MRLVEIITQPENEVPISAIELAWNKRNALAEVNVRLWISKIHRFFELNRKFRFDCGGLMLNIWWTRLIVRNNTIFVAIMNVSNELIPTCTSSSDFIEKNIVFKRLNRNKIIVHAFEISFFFPFRYVNEKNNWYCDRFKK